MKKLLILSTLILLSNCRGKQDLSCLTPDTKESEIIEKCGKPIAFYKIGERSFYEYGYDVKDWTYLFYTEKDIRLWWDGPRYKLFLK